MTDISIDAFQSNTFNAPGVTNVSLSITTTLADDIIVFIACNNSTTDALSSVASVPALTWNKRYSGISPGGGSLVDIYWAHATTAQAYAITGTYTTAPAQGGLAAYAINGCTSLIAPFDSNASLPVNQTANSGVTGISTTSASGLLLGIHHTSASGTETLVPSFTNTGQWRVNAFPNFLNGEFGVMPYKVTQTNQSITMITGSFFSSFFMDAIPGTFPAAPTAAPSRGSGFKYWWRELKSGLIRPPRPGIIPIPTLARG